jgi:hypothetical protein
MVVLSFEDPLLSGGGYVGAIEEEEDDGGTACTRTGCDCEGVRD